MTDFHITDEEIAALNAARTVLSDLADRCGDLHIAGHPKDNQLGRLEGACDIAGDAVFKVLNWTKAYLGVQITREQMHNLTPVVADPDAWAAVGADAKASEPEWNR